MKKLSYKDKTGTEWDLDLTIGDLKRLVNWEYSDPVLNAESLTNPSEKLLNLLLTDAGALFQMIFSIVEPQTVEKFPGKTLEEREVEFLKGVSASIIPDAREAFFASLGFFYPAVETAYLNYQKLISEMKEESVKKLEESLPTAKKIYGKYIEKTLTTLEKELDSLNIETSSESLETSESAPES